ncbi:MAG: single-stranded DNA-binding protein [Candidatus Melainabacteria bacterium]|nr:single-stranded DNA-binding protein [Candidatus Melainabacteria bacterium]
MNNQITIVGHVGQNPIERSVADDKVVKFSVAVKEFSTNNEKKTMWIDVDAWNKLGDLVMENVTKGREVAITGRLAINQFTKEEDGVLVKMSKPVIKLTSFHLCGARPIPVSETVAEEKPVKRKRLAAVNG